MPKGRGIRRLTNLMKLIASDIDGTLLLNGARTLDPLLFEQIRELKHRGILFLAASGREYSNLKNLFASVQDDIFYLCLNGCLLMDQDRPLFQATMKEETAHALITAIENEPDMEVLVSGTKTSYVKPKHESYVQHMRQVVGNDTTIVEDLHSIPEPYTKISAYRPTGLYEQEKIRDLFSDDLQISVGGDCWLDCTPRGINKGSAFLKLCDILHIDPKDTMMFADNDNDKEILEHCGLPVVMDSAKQKIKDLAAFTVPTVPVCLSRMLKDGSFDTEIL